MKRLTLLFLVFLFSQIQTSAMASCPIILDSVISKHRATENVVKAVVTDVIGGESTTRRFGERVREWRTPSTATLRVLENYKGSLTKGSLFQLKGSWRGCSLLIPKENLGKEYIIFARDKQRLENSTSGLPVFRVYSPGESQLWNLAHRNRLYYEKFDQVSGKSRLAGQFYCMLGCGPKVSNLAVEIKGSGVHRQLRTNEYGIFETYGLKNGLYEITIRIPDGFGAAAERGKPRGRIKSTNGTLRYEIEFKADVGSEDFLYWYDNRTRQKS